MVQNFSADVVYPITQDPIKNGVVSVDKHGTILFVGTRTEAREAGLQNIQKVEGALVPGLINAHCHLELSHMKGKVPKETGLVPFLKNIMSYRQAEEQVVLDSAASADAYMFKNGIVAVGDISNTAFTESVKRNSQIYYHTFIEILGVKPENAPLSMARGEEVAAKFEGLPFSITPHAPYSVSTALFEQIRAQAEGKSNLFSIHNQESDDENKLFLEGAGSFLDLYAFLGVQPNSNPPGVRSIQVFLEYLAKQRTVLVHNSFSTLDDVAFAKETHSDLYWCLCPRANLYIESALPNLAMLWEEKLNVVLGTDSLASNEDLNLVEEMKVIQDNTQIPFADILKWATWNGAEFLGISDRFGSLDVGKRPGLNLLSIDEKENILNTRISRLS